MAEIIKEKLVQFSPWFILFLLVCDSMLDVIITWMQNAPTDLDNVPIRDWVQVVCLCLKAGGAAAFAYISKGWFGPSAAKPVTVNTPVQ